MHEPETLMSRSPADEVNAAPGDKKDKKLQTRCWALRVEVAAAR